MSEAGTQDELPGDTVLQVSPRVRGAGQEGKVLREHQDHQERARQQLLRRQPQVPGSGRGGGGRRELHRAALDKHGQSGSQHLEGILLYYLYISIFAYTIHPAYSLLNIIMATEN